MNKEWLVTCVDINTWSSKCRWFDNEKDAREYVKERLEIQKEYNLLADKVSLFPPCTSVKI